MAKVVFNENSILSFKEEFNTLSRDIYDSLVVIEREISTIFDSLNTPKSKKNVFEMDVYLENQIKKIDNAISDYNQNFNNIIKGYSDFLDEVEKTVGGNNG